MFAGPADTRPVQRMMLCALLVATVVLLPGCAADERKQIADVLAIGLTSPDARQVCEGALSPALMHRIYGSAERCHAVESKDSERVSRATAVVVKHVRTH